jgi:uncharacterized protein (TIGR03382 family)
VTAPASGSLHRAPILPSLTIPASAPCTQGTAAVAHDDAVRRADTAAAPLALLIALALVTRRRR